MSTTLIQTQTSAPALTKDERDQIARDCFRSPARFLRTFMNEAFSTPLPWLHRGWLAILTRKTDFLLDVLDHDEDADWWLAKRGLPFRDVERELDKIVKHFVWKEDPEDDQSPEHAIFHLTRNADGKTIRVDVDFNRFTAAMIPRGFSKTTLAGQGVPLYWILYQEKKFFVYISETATHASDQLRNVRVQLEENKLILSVFGRLKPERMETEKWTDEQLQTKTGITVVARGRGGQVRGLNIKNKRPDCIILDDVEDEESVQTIEQRQKVRKWFYKSVKPAIAELNPDSTIIALGTLLHKEALLMTLMRDPDWTFIRFSAIDRDGEPLWELNMPLKKLARIKNSMTLVGELSSFYMEYMSMIRNDETAKFRESFFIHQHYGIQDCVARALVCDPAISQNKNADFCAFGVVGMTERGILPVLDTFAEVGMSPREQVDKFFELSIRWDITHHGIEAVAYQAALVHLVREEMFRKKRYFEIQSITHSQKKETRVEGVLQPRYANGYIVHTRRFPELESQLLDWPNGKKDVPDVVAMAITLLDPYAGQAGMDEGNDLGDDEYEDLDVVLEGDWKSWT